MLRGGPDARAGRLGDEAWVCWFEAQVNKADFFLRFAQNSFVTYWYTQHNDALLYFQHDTLLPAKLVLERFAPVHRGSVQIACALTVYHASLCVSAPNRSRRSWKDTDVFAKASTA